MKDCRIRVYEAGKLRGFLCPGGDLNRLRVHASIMTKDDAQQVVAILLSKPEVKAKGCSFRIVQDKPKAQRVTVRALFANPTAWIKG